MTIPFRYLITLEPLGLLYASSGRFLSAENLVGKAGEHFPPDSPAMSGLIASKLHRTELRNLFTAGPFWRNSKDLYLPAPLTLLQNKADENCLNRTICERLAWQAPGINSDLGGWMPTSGREIPAKPIRGGWISLSQWMNQTTANAMVHVNPWKAVPHLHPRLCDNERVSAQENALFMELAVALEPGVSLAYISSHKIPEGRYRFGGEGHLVELRCEQIPEALLDLLKQPIKASFALITPGVWGGSRLSQREPLEQQTDRQQLGRQPWHSKGNGPGILTDRPRPWRHRLGAGLDGEPRLSRGRWAVPAGSCYQVPATLPLPPWPDWPESWFPREGFSFKQFGTGLALPIP